MAIFCPKDCTNRNVGCHANCETYINACKEHQALKLEMQKSNAIYGYAYDTHIRVMKRQRHNK